MDTLYNVIWSGIILLVVVMFAKDVLANCIAEAITGCKKRIKYAERKMNAAKEESKAANERAAAAEEKIVDIEKREKEVEERENSLKGRELELNKEKQDIEEDKKTAKEEIRKEHTKAHREINSLVNKRAREKMPELNKILTAEEKAIRDYAWKFQRILPIEHPNLLEGIKEGRLHNYLLGKKHFMFSNLQVSAEVTTTDFVTDLDKKPYKTTLTSCTCDDFDKKHIPACKHMLYLAEMMGILQVYQELHREDLIKLLKESSEKRNKKQTPSQRTKTTSLSAEN